MGHCTDMCRRVNITTRTYTCRLCTLTKNGCACNVNPNATGRCTPCHSRWPTVSPSVSSSACLGHIAHCNHSTLSTHPICSRLSPAPGTSWSQLNRPRQRLCAYESVHKRARLRVHKRMGTRAHGPGSRRRSRSSALSAHGASSSCRRCRNPCKPTRPTWPIRPIRSFGSPHWGTCLYTHLYTGPYISILDTSLCTGLYACLFTYRYTCLCACLGHDAISAFDGHSLPHSFGSFLILNVLRRSPLPQLQPFSSHSSHSTTQSTHSSSVGARVFSSLRHQRHEVFCAPLTILLVFCAQHVPEFSGVDASQRSPSAPLPRT